MNELDYSSKMAGSNEQFFISITSLLDFMLVCAVRLLCSSVQFGSI